MARTRLHAPDSQSVTFVELFFDLVFVFAVTQVTVLTAGDLTAGGVVRSLVLFWLVWWAWTQFTWTLNPADTDHAAVRAITLLATAAAFVMAASVPRAYGDEPLWFVGPYLVVRLLGLGLQLRVDVERSPDEDHGSIYRWASTSSVFLAVVLVAGFVDPPLRTALFGVVLLGDLVSTYAARGTNWDLHAGHFAERHGLFVIIALGESLIVAGTAVAGEERTTALVAASLAALTVACLLWWSYFSWMKEGLEAHLAASPPERIGTLASDAFSLIHFVLICGIVAFAVAVEEIVTHPEEALHGEVVAALGAGVVLFVGGSALSWWRASGQVLTARAGILVLTVAGLVATSQLEPVWPLAAVAAGLLALVVVEETRLVPALPEGGERAASGEPARLEVAG